MKPTETMPKNIWEKLPTENVNQYAQFAAYRDMAYKGGAEAVIKMREDHALLGAQMIRKALPRLLKMPEEKSPPETLCGLQMPG